jgi:hypothetical protein
MFEGEIGLHSGSYELSNTFDSTKLKGIQIDCGKEFVNDKLEHWCKECSIEISLTAPYSPSQNGIAEHMNRTLVELSRATINFLNFFGNMLSLMPLISATDHTQNTSRNQLLTKDGTIKNQL